MSVGAIPIPPAAVAEPDLLASIPPLNVPPVAPPTPELNELTSAAIMPRTLLPDPVDNAVAAGLPPEGQNQLTSTVPPVEPKTPVEQAEKNVKDTKEAGDEQIKAAEEKAAIETRLATEKQKYLEEHSKEYDRLIQRQEAHRQEAEHTITELRAKAESAPYHTLWESRTNGQKVTIAIGLILSGISWNPQHVNRGVTLLQDAMKNEMELQKAKHADLWRAVNEAQQGLRDLDQTQLREISAFSASDAAKWDAIAGRLGAAAAANKGKGDIATLKKQIVEATGKANTNWQNSITAASQAKHLEEMDKERARHDLENEKLRAKKIGSGGTGSGSSRAMEEAAVKFREKIEAAKAAGTPLTGAQIDRMAFDMKIPPVAKAGKVSVKTILDKIKEEGVINKNEHTFSDKDENMIVRGRNGEPLGKERSAKLASAATKDFINRSDAADRMEELAEDIRKYGAKVDPTDQKAVQRRVSKFANAIIGIGIVSPLGKTNETLHLETKALGIPGVVDWEHLTESLKNYVLSAGANEENVRAKVHETRKNRDAFVRSLNPLTDEEKKKYARNDSGGTGDKKWVPIPARLSGEAEAKGKKEMLVSSSGKFLGEFR